MRRVIILCLCVFLSACSTKIERIPMKCNITPPIKPDCNDYNEVFDCGKAKAKYINALEKSLQQCL